MVGYVCPNCREEATHLVWEEPQLAELGLAPKFVGCTECNEMSEFSPECFGEPA